jgi:spore germination cell wall hydrolase CwlJ-like protein
MTSFDTFIAVTKIAAALTTWNEQLIDQPEVYCLAQNIYHEARGEGVAGQVAVASVTMNRMRDPSFPDTVCGVVFQPYQFSWTNDKTWRITDEEAWDQAVEVAALAYLGMIDDNVRGATFYYAHEKANPDWAARFSHVAYVGNHRFMREE